MYSKKVIDSKISEIETNRKIEVAENLGNRILFCAAQLTSCWVARKGTSFISVKLDADNELKELDPQEIENLNQYLKLSDGAREGWIVEVSENAKYCRITYPDGDSEWFDTRDVHIITYLPTTRPELLHEKRTGFNESSAAKVVKEIFKIIRKARLSAKEIMEVKRNLNDLKLWEGRQKE